MTRITQLVLDVLKPHEPDVAVFARHLANISPGLQVTLRVVEIDDKTQTLEIHIAGDDLDLVAISAAIGDMGASLHSIDEVQVVNPPRGD